MVSVTLEDRRANDVTAFSLLYCVKPKDSMLACVCSVIDQRKRKNMAGKNISDTLA